MYVFLIYTWRGNAEGWSEKLSNEDHHMKVDILGSQTDEK